MLDLFSDDARRNPFPIYAQIRAVSPLLQVPQSGDGSGNGPFMVFDYEGVNRVLTDHETFSSQYGPDWLIFQDPPRHRKLRALISQAFTPRSIAALEPRIRQLSHELLDRVIERGEMDLAADFAIPLPLMVIAEMLGVPAGDLTRFTRWNQAILNMSYTVPGTGSEGEANEAFNEFVAVTREIGVYLSEMLLQRQAEPRDDLLTRLAAAQVDGERLTPEEILGFFQLLLLAGSETTTNLINNAVLCFVEFPDQLARLQSSPELLPSAIEEVLRYRSPVQWMYRITRRDVEMHGQSIPAGRMILAMIGSANHDPAQFPDPERFDITRDPNPHLAFGHGIHFCLGAPLSRREGRIALSGLLERVKDFQVASDEPWEPRRGLHVHGPSRLPIRFRKG